MVGIVVQILLMNEVHRLNIKACKVSHEAVGHINENVVVPLEKVHKQNNTALGSVVLYVVPEIVIEDEILAILPGPPLIVHLDEAVGVVVGHTQA